MYAYHEYLKYGGETFFTIILLPEKNAKFPTVICRSPYVGNTSEKAEEKIVQDALNSYRTWLNRGYAIVFQHCRGQGKSTGAFVPYVDEHEDGLALRTWLRNQPFYNGELFLIGGSYGSSLHYATAPFEADVKGAVFEVQDSERYRLWYRNGQMRKGHANWHFALYKAKCGLNKNFNMYSFSQLPLKSLSNRVLGDCAEDFEQMLTAQYPSDEFWSTRFGGNDTKGVLNNTNIPVLLTTGYNDFYVGGVFKMWNSMSKQTKENCALLVSPYNHVDGYSQENGIAFENGRRCEQFGNTYQIDWFDHIRKGTPIPFKKGLITYYRAFENKWQSDFYTPSTKSISLPFGNDTRSFTYNPLTPTAFSEEGSFAKENYSNSEIIRIFTQPFDRDIFVKGKMKIKLTVSSNCPDTSFYVRISIKHSEYSYVLRHDITSLCYQLGDYKENEVVTLDFCFDEYAFLMKKGECLQIDIASTDDNTYVCHTNKKGPYYLQTSADTAINTVFLKDSKLILPVE